MDQRSFDSMRQYVGFNEEAAALLRSFQPIVEPHLETIVGDFYDAIREHPDAHQAITGGDAQIERLKRTLIRWLDSVLLGPHDEEYLASHARIGRVHVRIALPQQFMFTAMNRIRSALTRLAVSELHDDTDRCLRTLTAIGQMLDLELALMLDTYREDLLGRMRAHERLATIGQVAGSIGHELRNPLGIIESSLYLLRGHLGPLAEEDPKVQKHLTRIGTQVTVCGTTITHLLELARSRMPSKAWHPLREMVERAVEYASVEPSQVVLDIPADVQVLADAEQLRQVFTNLIQNAMQAQPRCTVTVTGLEVPGGTQIGVRDDGPGIPSDLHSRIFDALFTTRAKGTGLGLSLCRRILEAHRGEITLQPEERGAHFRLWLPDHDSDGRRSLVPDEVDLGGSL